MEFIKQYWPEILSLLIAAIALYVSWQSWQKSRTIYSIEYCSYRFKKGNEHPDNKEILDKLNSGQYTILNTHYGSPRITVILGKIKK